MWINYVEGFFLCVFYLWCKFSFLLSLGMIIYNNEFKINEVKFKPSIIHGDCVIITKQILYKFSTLTLSSSFLLKIPFPSKYIYVILEL